jgi:hypothetical protein
MTNEEFLQTLHQIQIVNALMQEMDLEGFLDQLARGEGIVPFIDPPMLMPADVAEDLRESVGIMYDCQQRTRTILDARCHELIRSANNT